MNRLTLRRETGTRTRTEAAFKPPNPPERHQVRPKTSGRHLLPLLKSQHVVAIPAEQKNGGIPAETQHLKSKREKPEMNSPDNQHLEPSSLNKQKERRKKRAELNRTTGAFNQRRGTMPKTSRHHRLPQGYLPALRILQEYPFAMTQFRHPLLINQWLINHGGPMSHTQVALAK